ncbi:hypothetical protein X732_33545 [Mesorhizobium sp. L2C066B000]|nr:hypothetical protein X732_33545 [Mesorhizobium sp. L2C066B000]
MRFKGLDLNLLVVLDALLSERGLTAAGRSINLTIHGGWWMWRKPVEMT